MLAYINNSAATLQLNLKRDMSQYTRGAYVHKGRKGHPRIAWKLEETVSKL